MKELTNGNTTHINEYTKRLCQIQTDMITRIEELKPIHSQLERQIQEVLHLLEFEMLNAPQRAKAVKRLTDLRKKRRTVKQEIYDINQALKSFTFNSKAQPKWEYQMQYTYSTDTVRAIFGEDDGE
nr:MAG TPA: hypothetical protein [Caudoviricetes sp.]